MKKNKRETKIISASTILILSGFLIGLTVGKIVSEALSPYVLSCGLAGFLAFIALELTGTHREEEEAHSEQVLVQGRLDRHVLSLSSMSFSLPREGATSRDDSGAQSHGLSDEQRLDELYDMLIHTEQPAPSIETSKSQA